MIQADQMTALALGCYGHPVAKTPHLDRLAAEGVLFENCYCNSPLCGPSRASMVSGRQPWRVASYDNANELPAAVPTFTHLLRRQGYEAWLSGKMHFVGPDQLHGFHGRMNTDIYPSSFEWTPDWRKGAYGNPGTSVHYLHHSGPCGWGLQLDYDEDTQALGLRCLRDLTRRHAREGHPSFLCVSFTHPHEPFNISHEYWDMYEGVDIPPPQAPAKPLEDMHPFDQWIQIHHEIDQYPPSEDTIMAARRAYLAMVTYVDAKVGELMAELDRLGIADDTAVLFTSDHGDMQGEHGMWYKRTFHEWSMRVPLVFWQPGVFKGGRRIESPVSLLDLFPTLTELGGAPQDWPGSDDLDGASLMGLLRGDSDAWDRPVIAEYLGEGILQPMRMIRDGRWKYVDVHEHEPLLFDLVEDPREARNLSGAPEVAEVEDGLRDRLLHGWDGAAMRERVMADQQQRLMLLEALDQGVQFPWDYQPAVDASRQYVRRGFSTQKTKRLQRWPYVPDD